MIIDYRIRNFCDIPQHIRRLKWFYQRGKRGWADCDWWGMDYYLVDIILPMLKELKEKTHGYPGTDEASTPEGWDNVLIQIIEGFEAAKRVLNDEYLDEIQPDWFKGYDKKLSMEENFSKSIITEESHKEWARRIKADQELFESRMPLFTKWFFALWD